MGGPVSGEKLVDGLDQGRGCSGSRGCRGLGACCVCGVRFLEEVGVVITSGDRWWTVRLRGVRMERLDGRDDGRLGEELLLLRLLLLELLLLLGPVLVQLVLLLLVLLLLLLLLQRVLLLPLL